VSIEERLLDQSRRAEQDFFDDFEICAVVKFLAGRGQIQSGQPAQQTMSYAESESATDFDPDLRSTARVPKRSDEGSFCTGAAMHKVSGLFYIGQPNETVSLTTHLAAGGQTNVTLDGQPIPGNTQFQLPANQGSSRTLQIGLFGPTGASCVVGISVVDGGSDADFLICQTQTPAPAHTYTFSVPPAASLTAFAGIRASKDAKTVKKRRKPNTPAAKSAAKRSRK
jgi:hypothetical protein